jgi:hypothetical protein
MTARVPGSLVGLAIVAATLAVFEGSASACLTNAGCGLASPNFPICSNGVCMACTSSADCMELLTAGPNCETANTSAKGSCFNCNTPGSGQACPASAPVCQFLGGLCVMGAASDAGADASDGGSTDGGDAGVPGDAGGPSDAASKQDADGGSVLEEAGFGMDASSATGEDASADAEATGADAATPYGSPGLLEGGACSCDLVGRSGAGVGANGIVLTLGVLAWRRRRRPST